MNLFLEDQGWSPCKISRIQSSGNGGEYTSKDFNKFCIEAGIRRDFTVPYNPQQNGVAERKNRTIIEATKEMIHDQSLPMNLWAEACMTTIYVQNISPHKTLRKMTLEEAFTRVKPEVGHFRIFGCSNIHSCTQGEKDQARPFTKKGYICGVQ